MGRLFNLCDTPRSSDGHTVDVSSRPGTGVPRWLPPPQSGKPQEQGSRLFALARRRCSLRGSGGWGSSFRAPSRPPAPLPAGLPNQGQPPSRGLCRSRVLRVSDFSSLLWFQDSWKTCPMQLYVLLTGKSTFLKRNCVIK